MYNTFFTSDSHFNHKKIIEYCDRPYSTAEEMNEDLVTKWNKIVSKNDSIYHLGDVSWGHFDLDRLNGRKFLILGNHDRVGQLGKYFETIDVYKELKGILPKQRAIALMHYPIESWNGKFHGAMHFHGHTHGSIDNKGLMRFDVGVDCWYMSPIPVEDILDLVPKRKEEEEIAAIKSRDYNFKQLNREADKEESNG